MLALLAVWIDIAVVAHGAPLGFACSVLAAVANNPRVWRLR